MSAPRIFSSIVILLLALSLAACAASELTQTWTDRSYKGGGLTSYLVVVQENDLNLRRMLEDGLTAELRQNGAQAKASYETGLSAEAGQSTIENAAKLAGADAYMLAEVSVIKNKEEEAAVVPPSPTSENFGGTYQVQYERGYHPGYVRLVTETLVRSSLYLSSSSKKIWTARSEAVNAESMQQVVKEVPRLLVNDLKEQGLLK